MDAWRELVAALKDRFDVVREGDEWLGILARSGERDDSIPVRVERGVIYDEPWVLVLVDVCASTHMDFSEALQRNVELATGSYALENERVVVRAAQPVTSGADSVTVMIRRLVDEAHERRAAIHDTRPTSDAFASLFPE
jgi:hypothetical protein